MADIFTTTIHDLMKATKVFEERMQKELAAAVDEFRESTGITPSDVDVRMIDVTPMNSELKQFEAGDVEISRDRFPRF